MLTSRIQQHHTAPRLSPAALEAAATAFLAEAEGKKASTIRNRSWRSVIQQGPSADALAWRIAQTEAETDTDTDTIGSAFRSDSDRRRPGGAARGVDKNTWNAIRVLALTDCDWPDQDVLIASAQYETAEEIGEIVGRCPRRVRQLQDRHMARARAVLDPAAIVAHLDEPITTEAVVPRAPSRRGRKARLAPRPVLALVPHTPTPLRTPRPYRPRAPRRRFVDPGQLDFLQAA